MYHKASIEISVIQWRSKNIGIYRKTRTKVCKMKNFDKLRRINPPFGNAWRSINDKGGREKDIKRVKNSQIQMAKCNEARIKWWRAEKLTNPCMDFLGFFYQGEWNQKQKRSLKLKILLEVVTQ